MSEPWDFLHHPDSPVLPNRRNLRSFLYPVRSVGCKHMGIGLLPSWRRSSHSASKFSAFQRDCKPGAVITIQESCWEVKTLVGGFVELWGELKWYLMLFCWLAHWKYVLQCMVDMVDVFIVLFHVGCFVYSESQCKPPIFWCIVLI